MWLRDACVCAQCRSATSNERLLDASAISPEIAIITAVNEPTAFGLGARGLRILRGCYVDIDHVRSERALATRQNRAV